MQVRITLRNTLQQVHRQDRAFAAHRGKDCLVTFLVSLHAECSSSNKATRMTLLVTATERPTPHPRASVPYPRGKETATHPRASVSSPRCKETATPPHPRATSRVPSPHPSR